MTTNQNEPTNAQSEPGEPLSGRLGDRFDLSPLGAAASAIATVYATTRSTVAVLATAAVAIVTVKRSGTR